MGCVERRCHALGAVHAASPYGNAFAKSAPISGGNRIELGSNSNRSRMEGACTHAHIHVRALTGDAYGMR